MADVNLSGGDGCRLAGPQKADHFASSAPVPQGRREERPIKDAMHPHLVGRNVWNADRRRRRPSFRSPKFMRKLRKEKANETTG